MLSAMSDPVTRLNAALEGRYAIERELGEGGMATVYLADDLRHERKVADLRLPLMPGGFHNIFTYRHSNGRSLLVATAPQQDAYVYDIAQVAAGVLDPVSAISVPNPGATNYQRWPDVYLGFLPDAGPGLFHGAGGGGEAAREAFRATTGVGGHWLGGHWRGTETPKTPGETRSDAMDSPDTPDGATGIRIWPGPFHTRCCRPGATTG